MPLRIVRNDLTLMKDVDAIVNTANPEVRIGDGCDSAVYEAAGAEELLRYRSEMIGPREFGDVFVTPSFGLGLKLIIHAVSPHYEDGENDEVLRGLFRKCLEVAREEGVRSVAMPLVGTGSFGWPRARSMAIAVDEINKFLFENELEICLVVFDEKSVETAKKLQTLDSYIDEHYVAQKMASEYRSKPSNQAASAKSLRGLFGNSELFANMRAARSCEPLVLANDSAVFEADNSESTSEHKLTDDEIKKHIDDRLSHLSDTFSEYLLYLIEQSGRKNSEVYYAAGIDKKVFSKIKNNKNYHPSKMTAMCLCVGAHLNLDQTRDLLMRAGYALSPSDKTDVIFSFFIEQEHFDIIDIDLALEENGLPILIA